MPFGERPKGPALALSFVRTGGSFEKEPGHRIVRGTPLPRHYLFASKDGPVGTNRSGGFFFELRKGRKILYRLSGLDPTGSSQEVPGPQGLTREKAGSEPFRFEVLVPRDLATQADSFALYSLEAAILWGSPTGEPVADGELKIILDDNDAK